MQSEVPGRLWDLDDLAKFLKVSRRTAYRIASSGRVPCIRLTPRADYRFDPPSVYRSVKEQSGRK